MPFRHGMRTIYAVQYRFIDGSTAICWLDEAGNAEGPWTRRKDGRPVVVTKPGETLLVSGKPLVVESVVSYREAGAMAGSTANP